MSVQAAATRPEWDPDPANSNDSRAIVGVDPLLPAKRHEVPGAIWWERRSHVENTPVF